MGPIPRGMFVCHHCDNKPCFEINHLFLGTPLDNMQDMVAKGKHYQTQKADCGECGLPLSGENLYERKDRPGRECRNCRKMARRRKYLIDKRAALNGVRLEVHC